MASFRIIIDGGVPLIHWQSFATTALMSPEPLWWSFLVRAQSSIVIVV